MKIEVDAVTRATPKRLAAPLQITDISTYEALHFDPTRRKSGTFGYQLSKPAWVRIRLVARQDRQLVLRTLMDWSPRDLGKNTGVWDGRDASGLWVDRRQYPCRFVIEGNDAEHEAHDREKCGDMALRITRPRAGAAVRGRVAVRLVFAGERHGYGKERGYTLRAYVDHERVAERHYAAPAAAPLEWSWDTSSLADGDHLLTLNLDDGSDHIGSVSVPVEIRK